MSMQAKIGNSLMKSLISLRQEKGELNFEDIGAMLEDMASTLNPGGTNADKFLRKEIERLASFIEQAKKEIADVAHVKVSDMNGEKMSEHIQEVIKTTENATNTIMDATDKIQQAASQAGGDVENSITESCSAIYEACNFQDITGQRLVKLSEFINKIDESVHNILDLFGDIDLPDGKAAEPKEPNLLTGPQLNDKAPTQDEIDALFNSLGS